MTEENAITLLSSAPASSFIIFSSSPPHLPRCCVFLSYDRSWRLKGKLCVLEKKKGLGLYTGREEAQGGHFYGYVCLRYRRYLCASGHLDKRTNLVYDITTLHAAGRNVAPKGEALWRRGKRREGRRRRGKGLTRKKSGTPFWPDHRTGEGLEGDETEPKARHRNYRKYCKTTNGPQHGSTVITDVNDSSGFVGTAGECFERWDRISLGICLETRQRDIRNSLTFQVCLIPFFLR